MNNTDINIQSSNKSNEYNPLVSIIVITYNSSKYVLETLESVKTQTYQNIELIVSDDCSTDDTVGICRNWIAQNEGRFVQTKLIVAPENTGIPANCNRGVKAAKGEWVKLIAGDDALIENCIETYVKIVNADSKKLVLFSNVYHYQDTFEDKNRLSFFNIGKLKISSQNVTAKEQFEILLRNNKVWAGSLFVSMRVFKKLGYYDESLKLWEDRPMLLKITQNNIKLHFVDFVSCKYRRNTYSVQKSKRDKMFITPFQLEKNEYYLKNYMRFLPIYERFIKTILIRRILLFNNTSINKNNFITKGFFYLSAIPWKCLDNQVNEKYK